MMSIDFFVENMLQAECVKNACVNTQPILKSHMHVDAKLLIKCASKSQSGSILTKLYSYSKPIAVCNEHPHQQSN